MMRPSTIRHSGLSVLFSAIAGLCVAGMPSARADDLIQYDLNGTEEVGSGCNNAGLCTGPGTVALTGTFTFDATTDIVIAANIAATTSGGPSFQFSDNETFGQFDTGPEAGSYFSSDTGIFLNTADSDDLIYFFFADSLSSDAYDPLIASCCWDDYSFTNASGGATPASTPEPMSLGLLGAGLAGIGVARRRKQT